MVTSRNSNLQPKLLLFWKFLKVWLQGSFSYWTDAVSLDTQSKKKKFLGVFDNIHPCLAVTPEKQKTSAEPYTGGWSHFFIWNTATSSFPTATFRQGMWSCNISSQEQQKITVFVDVILLPLLSYSSSPKEYSAKYCCDPVAEKDLQENAFLVIKWVLGWLPSEISKWLNLIKLQKVTWQEFILLLGRNTMKQKHMPTGKIINWVCICWSHLQMKTK